MFPLPLDEGIKEIIQKGEEIKKIKDARQKDEAKGKLENRLKNLAGLDSKNQKTKAFKNIYQFIWIIWTAKPGKIKKLTRELLDTS